MFNFFKKMKSLYASQSFLIVLAGLLVGLFGSIQIGYAAVPFTDDFDAYNDGDLHNQGSWEHYSTDISGVVQATTTVSGKAVEFIADTQNAANVKTGTNRASGSMFFQFKILHSGVYGYDNLVSLTMDYDGQQGDVLNTMIHNESGVPHLQQTTPAIDVALEYNVWYSLGVVWLNGNTSNAEFEVFLDNVSLGEKTGINWFAGGGVGGLKFRAYEDGSSGITNFYVDNITESYEPPVPPYINATLSLNGFVDAATSNWNFWGVSYDPKDDLYDTYDIKICYGYDSAAAVDCNKFIDYKIADSGDCDNATSTEAGGIIIPVSNVLIDLAEYHIITRLYGNNGFSTGLYDVCEVNGHLIAITDEITQTFTGDWVSMEAFASASSTWNDNYGTIWGAAEDSVAYTKTTNFISIYIYPVINKIRNMGGFMNATTSQEAGVAAGLNINLLFRTFNNINLFVPGFPFLTYALVYFGFLIGIGLWRWGHKTIKIIK